MKHIIQQYGWKPKNYDRFADKKEFAKEIEAHHVSRLYGVMMARLFASNSAIDSMFLERECFDAVGAVKECLTLTQDAFKDLYRCMYFVDNWESDTDAEWDEFFSDSKVGIHPDTATHRVKFNILEDGYNKRWQEVVNFGTV